MAGHLDVAVGSALLAVRRLIYDEHERPVQWLHGLYRPDRYEYEMQLSRVGSIDAKVWVSKDLSAQFQLIRSISNEENSMSTRRRFISAIGRRRVGAGLSRWSPARSPRP